MQRPPPDTVRRSLGNLCKTSCAAGIYGFLWLAALQILAVAPLRLRFAPCNPAKTIAPAFRRRFCRASLKKTLHASEQQREDVQRARAEWKQQQPDWNPTKLVFLDETAVATNLTRLRGRSMRGTRCLAPSPAWALQEHDLHCRVAL